MKITVKNKTVQQINSFDIKTIVEVKKQEIVNVFYFFLIIKCPPNVQNVYEIFIVVVYFLRDADVH